MNTKIKIAVALLTLVACTTAPLIPPNFTGENENGECLPGVISFEQEVLPLLTSNCAMSGCHDAISREDGVVLTDYDNIMREVTPFDFNNSELYECLVETNPDDIMPPPPATKFSTAQIQIIKDWINQGAMNTTCQGDCDSTVTATFAAVVYPIIEKNCVGCHNATQAQGGVQLHTHALIKTSVESAAFMGTIEHKAGYPVMPTSGVKLSDCNISLLNQWIAAGMPNN